MMIRRQAESIRPKGGVRYMGHYGKRNDPTRTRDARRHSRVVRQRRQRRQEES